ncbi:MAG: hypothetical protein WBD20_19655 [Pirellulaceae bacterium]
MSVNIYYRSIEPMHPAQAFRIKDHARQIASSLAWLSCDCPNFCQEKDGHLVGDVQPRFETDDSVEFNTSSPRGSSSSGDLLGVIEVLRELSETHGVDWQLSHDFEPGCIGRVIDGVVEDQLQEEIESVIQIGNLFGDVGLEDDSIEEEWEVAPQQFGVWRASIEQVGLRLIDDEPRVLKFPGVE